MNKQALLDNFVAAVNGKGQSRGLNADGQMKCVYFKDGHPGCAIGCQPGFKDAFGPLNLPNMQGIADLFHNKGAWYDRIRAFFSMDTEEDDCFLVDLQDLHDTEASWRYEDSGLRPMSLNPIKIRDFAEMWHLQTPAI